MLIPVLFDEQPPSYGWLLLLRIPLVSSYCTYYCCINPCIVVRLEVRILSYMETESLVYTLV